jgi:hypothetical protein
MHSATMTIVHIQLATIMIQEPKLQVALISNVSSLFRDLTKLCQIVVVVFNLGEL